MGAALVGVENDKCSEVGCTAVWQTAWVLVITTDAFQTYNYYIWEDDTRISSNLFLASLFVLYWGCGLLLSATLCSIWSFRLLSEKEELTDEDEGVKALHCMSDICVVCDFIFDEIPNLVIVSIFWWYGGLSGDRLTAIVSVVQALLATLTSIFHARRSWKSDYNKEFRAAVKELQEKKNLLTVGMGKQNITTNLPKHKHPGFCVICNWVKDWWPVLRIYLSVGLSSPFHIFMWVSPTMVKNTALSLTTKVSEEIANSALKMLQREMEIDNEILSQVMGRRRRFRNLARVNRT